MRIDWKKQRHMGRRIGQALFMRWLPALALLVILGGYGWIVSEHFTPGSREPDSDGYLQLAERFALGLPAGDPVDDPFAYHSHVWVDARGGAVIPKYTPGYPLLMAVAWRVAGPVGPFLVSPICGLLTLVGAWLLFQLWMPRPLAVCAVAVLAFGNMYLIYTNYVLAHAASMCVVTWGMYCLWRWVRNPRMGWAAGAGVLLAFAVTVRSCNTLLALVVAIAGLGVLARPASAYSGAPDRRRRLVSVLILGGCYGAVIAAFAAYNWYWFGHPLTTGYALSEEQSGFVLARLVDQAQRLLKGYAESMPAPAVLLGLLGLIACRTHTERLMRLAWSVPFFLLYAAYYWTQHNHGMMVQRFLLTTLPVVIGSGFALLGQLRLHLFNRFVLAVLIAGLSLSPQWRMWNMNMRHIVHPPSLQLAVLTAEMAVPALADGTVVFAHGVALHTIGFGRRMRVYHWDDLNAPRLAAALARQHPGAPRQQPERRERLRVTLLGLESDQAALRRQLVTGLLETGRPVAIIAPVHRVRFLQGELGPDLAIERLLAWRVEDVRPERWDGRRDTRTLRGEWGVYAVRAALPGR